VCRGVVRIEVDGQAVSGDVPLSRDGARHVVRVTLGRQV
jgi:hypothetical protein